MRFQQTCSSKIPMNSKVFRSRSEKFKRRLFCSKRHKSPNRSSEHVKCNIYASAETYREKTELILLQIRKWRIVSNSGIYKLSSKRSSRNVECSFDDHREKLPRKADWFPFKLRKLYGGNFSKRKYNFSKISSGHSKSRFKYFPKKFPLKTFKLITHRQIMNHIFFQKTAILQNVFPDT